MANSKKARHQSARGGIGEVIRRLREGYGFGRLIAVIVLGLVGVWLAFALAVSGVARQRAPQQALLFVPWDGVAIAANADVAMLKQKKPDPVALERAGKAALRNQAISARALRLLAMAAELNGDGARGEKLTELAQSMSRRDMVTQFWMIESAIRKNDVDKAVSHYDIALRTNSAAAEILFPRLQVAISNDRIRRALLPYFKAQVPWTNEFVEASINGGTNLSALTSLIIENGGLSGAGRERQQHANLLDALFNQQKFGDLRRLYLNGPSGDPARLASLALADTDRRQMISAVGWQLLNDAEAGGGITLDRGTRRPVMALYANPGTTRAVARKLLYLQAGNYRFEAKLGSVTRGEGGGLAWYLHCLDPAAAVPAWKLENMVRSTTATLAISQGCKVQLVEVHAAGGRGQTGMEALVTRISLTRI